MKRSSLLVASLVAMASSAFTAADAHTPVYLDAPRPPKPQRRAARGQSKRRSRPTFFEPNGERECARRRRQIEAGTLKVSA